MTNLLKGLSNPLRLAICGLVVLAAVEAQAIELISFDPVLQVRYYQTTDQFHYVRNGAVWPNIFMHYHVNTEKGRWYRLSLDAQRNTHTLRVQFDKGEALAATFQGLGSKSVLFLAKGNNTLFHIAGTNSLRAEMVFSDLKVEPVEVAASTEWQPDLEVKAGIIDGQLKYHRNDAPYPAFYLRRTLQTVPGLEYTLTFAVEDNSHVFDVVMDGVRVAEISTPKGEISTKFVAQKRSYEIAIGGRGNLNSQFTLADFQVSRSIITLREVGVKVEFGFLHLSNPPIGQAVCAIEGQCLIEDVNSTNLRIIFEQHFDSRAECEAINYGIMSNTDSTIAIGSHDITDGYTSCDSGYPTKKIQIDLEFNQVEKDLAVQLVDLNSSRPIITFTRSSPAE